MTRRGGLERDWCVGFTLSTSSFSLRNSEYASALLFSLSSICSSRARRIARPSCEACSLDSAVNRGVHDTCINPLHGGAVQIRKWGVNQHGVPCVCGQTLRTIADFFWGESRPNPTPIPYPRLQTSVWSRHFHTQYHPSFSHSYSHSHQQPTPHPTTYT